MQLHVPHIGMWVWTWVTFFSTAVLSFLLQVKASGGGFRVASFLKHSFPGTIWRQKSSWIDIVMYVGAKLINKLPFGFNLVCTTAMAQLTSRGLHGLFSSHSPFAIDYVTILLCSVVAFVVVDFANYLSHFLQHFVPALWELHKVHHSATSLTPFTTERMHPFGNVFDGVVAGLLVGFPCRAVRLAIQFSPRRDPVAAGQCQHDRHDPGVGRAAPLTFSGQFRRV
jgi:sterol desaturase/sphingolipid hydroxylase (fatty acid hydroxylase superfamily)